MMLSINAARHLLQYITTYSSLTRNTTLNKVAPNCSGVNGMWEMLHEKVYKTRINALELSMTLLTNDFRSDDIAQL